MSEQRLRAGPLRFIESRREGMLEPDEVSAMLRLKELGWGARRIARELGVSRNTVKGYLEAGGRRPYRQPARGKKLSGQESWLKERFARHRGNADVIRQELAAEKGIVVSLRRRRGRRRALRRRRASSSRSTLASAWSRSPAARSRRSCLSRRSAIRGGCMCERSAMSARRAGLSAWRAPSPSLAG